MAQTVTTRLITRRRFLQLCSGLALSATSLIGYTRFVEPGWLAVEQIPLALPQLPPELVGKRIAQLSDIHLSQYFPPARLLAAVETVNALAPDWLFITGDYVGDDARAAEGLVEAFRRLTMPTFVSYGNHDYWSDLPVVQAMLAATPVRILRNEAVQLTAHTWLAGVDDLWSGRPDLKAALRAIPADALTLLLAHEPDFFDQVLRAKAPVAMQFSGHSHGGQVRLPVWQPGFAGLSSYAPLLPRYGRHYPIGLRNVGDQQVYTNRGLGVWPVPFRFNCHPELSLFTLQPAVSLRR